PGSLTLNGASTYGGGTTVSGGTLLIGNDSAVGTGPLALDNATTIELADQNHHMLANDVTLNGVVTVAPVLNDVGPTLTLNGTVSGMGSLVVTSNLDLNGNNSYSGGTTVNVALKAGGPTLGIGSNSALGSGPLALNNNTAFFASVMAPVPGI